MPVSAQDGAMSVEVVLEGRFAVGGLEYCEEFWNEIDQHGAGISEVRAEMQGPEERLVETLDVI